MVSIVPWVLGIVSSNNYRQQSTGKLYFVGFLLNPRKIEYHD
jgi:hypothetical protein